jgi:hypothetical protein
MIQTFLSDAETVGIGNNQVKIGGGAAVSTWKLALERLAVRVDMTLTSKTDLSALFKGISFSNLPDRVPITSNYDLNAISRENTAVRNFMLSGDARFEDIPTGDMPAGAVWGKKLTRVILPENIFTPVDAQTSALKLTVLLDAQYNPSATIGIDENAETSNFTLPHNYNLKVNGDVAMPLLLNIAAADWGLVGIDGSTQGNRWVNVSETSTTDVVTPLKDLFISFSSNQPNATLDPNTVTGGQTQPLSLYYENLTDGTQSNFSYQYNNTTKTGNGAIRLRLKDAPTVPESLGEHQITLKLSGTDGSENALEYKITVKDAVWFAYAPPGVIGIGRYSRELTIGGSDTYAGQTGSAFALNWLEGVNTMVEPVYVVYFKWGSTIAVTGGHGDTFDKNDIVWAPAGYKRTENSASALEKIRTEVEAGVGAQAQWDLIPYGDPDGRLGTVSVPTWPSNDDLNGLGDPCTHLQEDIYISVMSGNPWQASGRYPFGTTAVETANYPYWYGDIPAGPSSGGIISDDGNDMSMFLPAAGWRNTAGDYLDGDNSGPVGMYWSSTPGTVTNGYAITFSGEYLRPSATASYANGMAVRCRLVPIS